MKFPQTVSISFMQSQNVLPEWHGNSPSAQCHSCVCVCKWTNLIHLITLCLHDTSPLPNIAYTYRFHCICKTEQPVSDLFTSFYQILSSMKVPFAVIPVPEAEWNMDIFCEHFLWALLDTSFYQMPVSGPQHLDHWNFDATLLRWQKKITLEAKPTDFTWQLHTIATDRLFDIGSVAACGPSKSLPTHRCAFGESLTRSLPLQSSFLKWYVPLCNSTDVGTDCFSSWLVHMLGLVAGT